LPDGRKDNYEEAQELVQHLTLMVDILQGHVDKLTNLATAADVDVQRVN
jgi:hypothetical protein